MRPCERDFPAATEGKHVNPAFCQSYTDAKGRALASEMSQPSKPDKEMDESSSLLTEARGLRFTARRVQLAHRVRTLLRDAEMDVFHYEDRCEARREFIHSARMARSEATFEPTSFMNEDYDELKKNFRSVKEENLKLQAVITDVTEVNKRWQRYNNDRQMYVQRLLSTIQEQQEQINKIGALSALTMREEVRGEATQIEAENLLRGEIDKLQKQLQEHEREESALRLQAQMHKDDWEVERAEKQAAVREQQAAESKASKLAQELRALRIKIREDQIQNCSQCPRCGYRFADINFPLHEKENQRNTTALLARGAVYMLGDDSDITIDSDIGSEASWNSSTLKGASSSTSFENNDNDLWKTSTVHIRKSNSNDQLSKKLSSTLFLRTDDQSDVQHLPSLPSSVNSVNIHSSDEPKTKISENGVKMKIKRHHDSSPNSTGGSSFSVISGEGAVTLGFNSSGLASVTAFKSEGPKYDDYDEGVATLTHTNVICPGCKEVFPPDRNLDFLDHFELCQGYQTSKQKL